MSVELRQRSLSELGATSSNNMSRTEQSWLTKHGSRFNPTERQLLQRKDFKRPIYSVINEDSDHVILCRHQLADECFGDHVLLFEEKLARAKTHLAIKDTILSTLYDRRKSTFESNVPQKFEHTLVSHEH